MANKLQVVTSPHIRDDKISTARIMQDVLLALLPAAVAGGCIFGLRALLAIRCFGSYPEGVSYSILLMNLVTPLIDRWCQPSPFGARAAAPARKGGSAA